MQALFTGYRFLIIYIDKYSRCSYNHVKTKVNELRDNQSFIWVDTCSRIKNFKNISFQDEGLSYCVLLGQKGVQDFELFEEIEDLTDDVIFLFFNNSKQSFFNMN